MAQDQVNVRYMVNDVQESVDWYTAHLDSRKYPMPPPPSPT